MGRTSRFLIGLVAALHLGFLVVEMLLWSWLAPKVGLYKPQEILAAAKDDPASRLAVSHAIGLIVALGGNSGLYNGVLAGALIWLLRQANLDPRAARSLALYLLASIAILGLYGGRYLLPTIPMLQTLPALVALVAVYLSPVPAAIRPEFATQAGGGAGA